MKRRGKKRRKSNENEEIKVQSNIVKQGEDKKITRKAGNFFVSS